MRSKNFVWQVILACTAMCVIHADWPRYLGNNYGQADVKIARSWPSNGPKVLWQQKLGVGYGGACIHNKEVFLLDRVNNEKDVLRCFALGSGKELWSVSFVARGRLSYDGSRSTPAVNDTHVYAFGPFGDIYCVDRKSHKVAWTKSLTKTYGFKIQSIPHRWGFSQSPLLHDGKVILSPCISRRVGLVALDAKTGKEVWNNKEFRGQTYVSPMVYNIGGVEQVVVMVPRTIAGVDPKTGKTLWAYKEYKNPIPIPTITPLGNDRFFITGGYNSGSVVVTISKQNSLYKVKTEKRLKKGAQIHPGVFINNHIYVNLNENANLGSSPPNLACLNSQGKILWESKKGLAIGRGGMITINGLLLILAGQSGKLHLLEPSPAGAKELATAQIFEPSRQNYIWAPIAFSDGKLVIRDQTNLKCLDLK
ncbi:PQQ-binding-like beta-propeller repeat protein [Candidatus Uabimicrobium sp. HlEnr_7]|uniref:outer membrane protein assembly factor BamB family protein n=1 Tax=Candidatus Uabimicrobium helgolandensis TaxID=3095367 RepID=UPI0035588626